MFGKKKDSDAVTQPTTDTGQDSGRSSYLKPDASSAASGVSRPASNPDISRRPPDLSAFAPRRADSPASSPAASSTPASTGSQGAGEMKKLIVGREINLNGEVRNCDSLVVEGTVEAVLSDCRSIELAPSGQFKGSANVESADVSGRFDGELTVNGRLTVRSTGKVLGKVNYGQLEIERGGILSGTVEALPETARAAGITGDKLV